MQVKKIVADENINFNIIKNLRNEGLDIYSILENHSGVDDESVISIAKDKKAILLTEDSDFGEWVFAHGIKDICVIFIRYHHNDLATITTNLKNLLNDNKYSFRNNFFVLTSKKIRVREIKA